MGRVLVGDGLGERHQPTLGSGVCRHTPGSAGLAGTRSDGHDPAVALLPHVRQHPSGAQEAAGQVDGERPVPQLAGRLFERHDGEYAGVDDQHRHRAQGRLDGAERPVHGVLVADITGDPQDAWMLRCHKVERRHPGAVARQRLRDRLADAARRTGDHGNASRQALDLYQRSPPCRGVRLVSFPATLPQGMTSLRAFSGPAASCRWR